MTRGRPTTLRDMILDDWVTLGGREGAITMDRFATRVGMRPEAWQRMFQRARAAGDPRAVRPRANNYRRLLTNDELLDAWAQADTAVDVFAAQHGLSFEAWRSALRRARNRNDPRATRNDLVRTT